jgi:translation initiation factor IF-2
MEKVRIYELAKELNTTSKRLMEKLAEININIKNHMSFLDEDQLKALYDHIGVITHKDDGGEGVKKQMPRPPMPAPRVQPPPSRERSKEPRIIRKTEVILDTNGEDYYRDSDKQQKKAQRKKRRDYVKVADDTSGLRAGFVRDTGTNFMSLKIALEREKKEAEERRKRELEEQRRREEEERKLKEAEEARKREAEEQRRREEEELKRKEAEELKKKEEEEKKRREEEELKRREAEKAKAAKTPKQKDEIKAIEKDIAKPAREEKPGREEKAEKQDIPAETVSKAERKEQRPESAAGQVKPEPAAGQVKQEPATGQVKPEPAAKQVRPEPAAKQVKPEPGVKQAKPEFKAAEIKKPAGEVTTGKQAHTAVPGRGEKPGREAVDIRVQDRKRDKQTGKIKPAELIIPDLPEEVRMEKGQYKADKKFSPKAKASEDDREVRKESGKFTAPPVKKKFNAQSIILGGKKNVAEILTDGFDLDELILDYGKKKRPSAKKGAKAKGEGDRIVQTHKPVKIPERIVLKDLAEKFKKSATEVIKKLMSMGMMVTINEEVDYETAAIIADEFGIKIEKEIVVSEEDILFDDNETDDEKDLVPRAPIVVVMGHVDHGKTSLLDAIREENVTGTEVGGITQHIGAYTVTVNGRDITFIDTPGHEAFTSLRARGAQVTDIAILVVAADDGVMPQTIEAINHAKAAKVSIIVAINKIDLPGANPDRVKQQLAEHGLIPEEWGGDVIYVPISAKHRQNLDELLDMVLLTADILELKANPDRQAKGTVIEAKLDKTRGPIATLLVQRGTLHHGDSIVTGTTVGRIRAMTDDKGREIEKAGPSMPVEILGLPEVPTAGEVFYAIKDEKVAKHLVEKRKDLIKQKQMQTTAKVSLEDLFSQIKEGNIKELNIIVKADTQGSVEAVRHSLEKIKNDEVKVKIIHGGVGAVTESDVNLASVSNALIIGFNVRPGTNVKEIAESLDVDMRFYRVIYDAIDDIEAAMKGMLEPKYREVLIGHVEVRQIFKVSGVGTVAGCYVTDGKILRNSDVRIVRDGVVIHEGELASLKRFKDDVREVAQGYECGISIEKFNDIKEGDIIEAYTMEQVER